MSAASRGSIKRRTWAYEGQQRTAFQFCFVRDGRRYRGQAPTRAEALALMEMKKADLERAPSSAAVTLSEYADKWLVNIAPSIATRTQ